MRLGEREDALGTKNFWMTAPVNPLSVIGRAGAEPKPSGPAAAPSVEKFSIIGGADRNFIPSPLVA